MARAASLPVRCKRCGRPLTDTEETLCATCEDAMNPGDLARQMMAPVPTLADQLFASLVNTNRILAAAYSGSPKGVTR